MFFLTVVLIFLVQLQMGTLQSRLDADFLLAHMCSVKFKEWIVVLATLLRRSEVCTFLFTTFAYMLGNFTYCCFIRVQFNIPSSILEVLYKS